MIKDYIYQQFVIPVKTFCMLYVGNTHKRQSLVWEYLAFDYAYVATPMYSIKL